MTNEELVKNHSGELIKNWWLMPSVKKQWRFGLNSKIMTNGPLSLLHNYEPDHEISVRLHANDL
jgi:hypothetical protein